MNITYRCFVQSGQTYHAMTTLGPVSEGHVLCATAFMVPLCAGAPQPLALFLCVGGGGLLTTIKNLHFT